MKQFRYVWQENLGAKIILKGQPNLKSDLRIWSCEQILMFILFLCVYFVPLDFLEAPHVFPQCSFHGSMEEMKKGKGGMGECAAADVKTGCF